MARSTRNPFLVLIALTLLPQFLAAARPAILQFPFGQGKEGGWRPMDSCPQIDFIPEECAPATPHPIFKKVFRPDLPTVQEVCSCGKSAHVKPGLGPRVAGQASESRLPRRWSSAFSPGSLRSSWRSYMGTFFELLVIVLTSVCWWSSFLFACPRRRPKSTRRSSASPMASIARQWAGDMGEVFVIFPFRCFRCAFQVCVVMPLRAVLAVVMAIRAARKTHLQRKLLEEIDPHEWAKGRGKAGSSASSARTRKRAYAVERRGAAVHREGRKEPESIVELQSDQAEPVPNTQGVRREAKAPLRNQGKEPPHESLKEPGQAPASETHEDLLGCGVAAEKSESPPAGFACASAAVKDNCQASTLQPTLDSVILAGDTPALSVDCMRAATPRDESSELKVDAREPQAKLVSTKDDAFVAPSMHLPDATLPSASAISSSSVSSGSISRESPGLSPLAATVEVADDAPLGTCDTPDHAARECDAQAVVGDEQVHAADASASAPPSVATAGTASKTFAEGVQAKNKKKRRDKRAAKGSSSVMIEDVNAMQDASELFPCVNNDTARVAPPMVLADVDKPTLVAGANSQVLEVDNIVLGDVAMPEDNAAATIDKMSGHDTRLAEVSELPSRTVPSSTLATLNGSTTDSGESMLEPETQIVAAPCPDAGAENVDVVVTDVLPALESKGTSTAVLPARKAGVSDMGAGTPLSPQLAAASIATVLASSEEVPATKMIAGGLRWNSANTTGPTIVGPCPAAPPSALPPSAPSAPPPSEPPPPAPSARTLSSNDNHATLVPGERRVKTRHLGPPPDRPAPPPPPNPRANRWSEPQADPPTDGWEPAGVTGGTGPSLEDGWLSGGTGDTGGTSDVGWNPMGSDGRGIFGGWLPRLHSALAENRLEGNSERGTECGDLGTCQETIARASDDVDMCRDLESMVEMLTEVNTFQKDLFEDAASKVDAAKEALEALRQTWQAREVEELASAGSLLRMTAPVFVPGEEWSGKQMSGFDD